jgi:hypothetical protein
LYVGIDTVTNSDVRGASRVVVKPLPGRAGVTLDYDIFNPAFPDNPRGHAEHTVIARTHAGEVVMVVADTHSPSVVMLYEGAPGVFEPLDGAAPYPQRVVLSMPEPDRIRHAWWYGSPGESAVERDVSDLRLAE